MDGNLRGKEEVNLFGLGVVFEREQGTARRNDGPPTCFDLFFVFEKKAKRKNIFI